MKEEYFHTAKEEWEKEKTKPKFKIQNVIKHVLKKETIILLLIGMIYLTTLNEAEIKTINETKEGDYIRINGTITKCVNAEHLTIINLTDETGSIKTIFFGNENCIIGQAEVTGRLNTYKQEKELIGARLK